MSVDEREAYAATLAEDMVLLGGRPYAEVGVPMFLIGEDCRADGTPRLVTDEPGQALAAELARMAEACAGAGAELAGSARLVEVLADRLILGDRRFTAVADEPAR